MLSEGDYGSMECALPSIITPRQVPNELCSRDRLSAGDRHSTEGLVKAPAVGSFHWHFCPTAFRAVSFWCGRTLGKFHLTGWLLILVDCVVFFTNVNWRAAADAK